MTSEKIEVVDLHFRTMRNQLFPVRLARTGVRGGHHAKVFRALVAANVEETIAVIDVVLVISFAWTNDLQFGAGIVGGQVAPLGRRLAFGTEQNERLIARTSGADIKQFVFLFKDKVGLITAQHVAEKLVRAFGDVIFRSEEDRFVISGPNYIAHALECFRQELSGAQVFDVKCVLAIAGSVCCVRKQRIVVARRESADAEKLETGSELILIEQYFFLSIRAIQFATANRILLALLGTRVIKIFSPTVRHTHVGFFDVPDHLLIELGL